MNKDWLDEDGHWSYELELRERWESCPQEEKDRIVKYLKLMKWFNKDPRLVTKFNKKWLLENCDVETEIVPVNFQF